MNKCTIIMYHYVRELEYTRYPKIKARQTSEFKDQIKYLENNYEFVTVEDIIDVIYGKNELPDNAALLTFDDGYKDHYENVFPILEDKGIQGVFFPPAKAILKDEVLDVNKIHYILAINEENDNIDGLLNLTLQLLNKYRKEYSLKSNKEYYSELAVEGRYDPKEIIFIKRLFQRELPDEARRKILNDLLEEYMDIDVNVLSNELYMNIDQLRCMQRNDMHIGSHGYGHYWLDSITRERLEVEIESSIEFLKKIGIPKEEWTVCYPYGAYNDEIIELLQKKGFKLGFTIQPEIADMDKHSAMELPRLDTNDIPY